MKFMTTKIHFVKKKTAMGKTSTNQASTNQAIVSSDVKITHDLLVAVTPYHAAHLEVEINLHNQKLAAMIIAMTTKPADFGPP